MAIEYASRASVRGRRRETVDVAAFLRRLDWLLVGAVGGLIAYGLWAIAGITHHDVTGNSDYYVVRQGVFVAVGFVGFLVALLIDADWYRRHWQLIFVGTAIVIAIVFVAGPVARGSRRWLDLGFFRFQPSEFGKLLFVLFLAGYLADRSRKVAEGDARTTLTAVGLALVPIGLVFLQPDFGTALVYGAALVGVLFVAGTRWTHLAVGAAAAVVGALLVLWILPAAGVHVLKPYQEQRLVGFTNPSHDPSGATYNVNQSIIS